MKKEEVEIFSDATNQAVMKHPERNYPGVLIQGDTLYSICKDLDEVYQEIKAGNVVEAFEELNEIRNSMWERLNHYKAVLGEHDIELPFSEQP
ncbi:DUF6959 family protein [Sessilibacter sp. MAH4]